MNPMGMKGLFQAALLSFGLACGANALAAEVLELELSFPEPRLQVDAGGYTHVSLPGAPNLARPGAPALPVWLVQVALPPGGRVRSLEVELLGLHPLEGFHEVFPAQPPRPLSRPAPALTGPDPEVYRAAGLFPAQAFEARPVQGLRGVGVQPVAVWPVRSEPAEGRLWFAPRARVRVVLEPGKGGTGPGSSFAYRGLAADLARAARLVANPDVLGRYPLGPGKDPGDARYVVVTAAALVGCPGEFGLEALLAEKQLRGLTTRLETVEAIRAAYPGRDDAEKVRAFLKERYLQDGTEFVLLLGDADLAVVGGETEPPLVPARSLRADIGFGWDDVPSDLYYACLDGDFDANGNGLYGEPDDAPDLMAELDVGRAPVDSCAEVENFVRKTLTYQATQAAYLQRAQFAGEWLWDDAGEYNWGKTFLEQIHHSSDELLPTLGFDQSAFYQVATLYDRDLGGPDSWGAAEILGVLNANPHLVNHLGHSYTNYALRLTTDQLVAGIANSLPFLVYTQGCYPGAFDNRLAEDDGKAVIPQDSFVEHMLLGELGAFAAVMNTRYGLGWSSNYYHRTFWDALFRAGERRLGAMQSYSRDALAGFVPGDEGMRWIHYDCTLFGDPELELKTSASSEPVLGVPARPIRWVEVLDVGAPQGGVLAVRNDGLGSLTFEVESSAAWLVVSPAAGAAPAQVSLGVDPAALGVGLHTAELTVRSPEAANSPQVVGVEVEVLSLPSACAPFRRGAAPRVDGTLQPGEWDEAVVVDLAPDAPGQKLLRLLHDGGSLWLAVEIAGDATVDDWDYLQLGLDADGDGAWPLAAGDEGVYAAYAYPGERYFLAVFDPGTGPVYGDDWEYPPAGFELAAGAVPGGRVWEVGFDLGASHLRRTPGQRFGLDLQYFDYAFGAWVPLLIWPGLSLELDPRLFGRLSLSLDDAFEVAPAALVFEAEEQGPPSARAALSITALAGSLAGFRLESSQPWLRLSALAGETPAAFEVWADPDGLPPGEHQAFITLRGTGTAAYFAPREVPVTFRVTPACPDGDGDGHLDAACGGDDCDDENPSVHPGAEEVCGDGLDQDCDGQDLTCPCPDADGDGFLDAACGGDDCDDENPSVHPGAEEVCGDGLDQDCDGQDLACPCPDGDGDGHLDAACGGDDCDDENPSVHPGAAEICGDGLDQDCDGQDLACEPDPDEVDSGCGAGCTTGGGPAGLGWALMLAGLAVLWLRAADRGRWRHRRRAGANRPG